MIYAEKRLRAREMARAGATVREIRAELGYGSDNSVRRLLDDGLRQRELDQQKRRRDSAPRGRCCDCGGPTSPSRRGDVFSERCVPCRIAFVKGTIIWTEEKVLDAIRRYAEMYGLPPTMRDWRKCDRERGFPSSRSVYRTAGRSESPFASWADAIEAAGFPRPPRVSRPKKQRVRKARKTSDQRAEEKMDARLVEIGNLSPREFGQVVPNGVVKRLPPSETPKGRISAQLLTTSYDCQAYACVRDAEPGEMFCRKHLDSLAKTG